MNSTKAVKKELLPINIKFHEIDFKQRPDAERALLDANDRDIDDFMYLFNIVHEMTFYAEKINEIIEQVNLINGYSPKGNPVPII